MSKPASRKRTPSSGPAYQLKITLKGSQPPIWRRLQVPADCKLETLHWAIQMAMGWEDDHLHCFHIEGHEYMGRDPMGGKMDSDGEDAALYRLSDLVRDEKAKFTYEYDFGDDWNHTIVLEKIISAGDAALADSPNGFACLAGKGACPPEDCGGIWGYYSKLEILQNPKHPSHAEMMEWMGHHDPDAFDLAAVNKKMSRIQFD